MLQAKWMNKYRQLLFKHRTGASLFKLSNKQNYLIQHQINCRFNNLNAFKFLDRCNFNAYKGITFPEDEFNCLLHYGQNFDRVWHALWIEGIFKKIITYQLFYDDAIIDETCKEDRIIELLYYKYRWVFFNCFPYLKFHCRPLLYLKVDICYHELNLFFVVSFVLISVLCHLSFKPGVKKVAP